MNDVTIIVAAHVIVIVIAAIVWAACHERRLSTLERLTLALVESKAIAESENAEDLEGASLTLGGPSGPMPTVVDPVTADLAKRVVALRREQYRLTLEAELLDLQRRLEIPSDQRGGQA